MIKFDGNFTEHSQCILKSCPVMVFQLTGFDLFFRYSTKLPDSDGETSWLKEDTVRLQAVGNSIGPKFAIPCYN